MNLRDSGSRIRGNLVGRVGVEPTTKRLRVDRPNDVFLGISREIPLSHSPRTPHFSPAISEGLRGTFRASIRCECAGCGNHKKRYVHIAGRRVSRTRHPVVIHRISGRVLCHVCLNRMLDLECRRLYSSGRTWLR